ncbi:uncharacterized protein LOC114526500 [Dendronephthya gigantea]|uniref:uncharacterized protein LOC114526500 n=1 Tax=Dendronephthya gigantea TaxID=151771 RepID=UPI00106A2404|nr:uncharacterized protein LOC114526500 [Dendronephthya gigantea]
MVVRDRQKKHKLLICTNDDGIFGWRTLDGSSPTGEFFSPAYDCTSILNKDPKAKDGFYWITLGYKIPRKVYCDMTTDGGGFYLVGRKNTSITWTVPSSNTPVEPFGDPHWISSLGNAPIIDFRVQVSSQEKFEATKAHWYYRLRKPRALKNLMIINKGGCKKSSPGIGDVQFVKNLLTDTVVTRNFRCSKFGVAHNAKTQFGWARMNYCLQRPCRWGFAFHHKFPLQTDYSGAFSYSTKNRISGINYGATAFIGCDNGQCCGCYGPKNGTKNYCFKECDSRKWWNSPRNCIHLVLGEICSSDKTVD